VGVRPEFQPTLPALMRRRTGWRERTIIAVLLLALLALIAGVVLVRPRVDRIGDVVHRGEPAFTMQYRNDLFREAEPRAGELARIEGRRGRQSVTITVRPLELPAYEGDVAHALLPVYASRHIDDLAASVAGFELRAEHRARINDAPGYEVRFRSGSTFGSDLLLAPADDEEEGALLVSLRRDVRGRPKLSQDEEEFADLAMQAMRSIEFGSRSK
jgi:hypothetical protein